jgi:uncharacterized protein (DUF2236 family)
MAKIVHKQAIAPLEDYGFFGPDSVTWKVWGYASTPTVGLQRSVVIEELDPALVAAVTKTQDIYNRPRTRYERTVHYFATAAFGDTRSATHMADILVKVHSRAVGIEPLSGNKYDANDPYSQLWILVTGWHSVLKAYEMFGPGKLSEAEENQYWEECAIAAQLQTIDPRDVPRTRAGVRAYFEQMKPKLAGSLIAQKAMKHLLHGEAALPPLPLLMRPIGRVLGALLNTATIATIPRYMRSMGDIHQSRLADLAIRPVMKAGFFLLQLSPAIEMTVLKSIAPKTVAVVAPAKFGIPPKNPIKMTPYESQELYGYDRPALAHLELRAQQAMLVFDKGHGPDTKVIIESQAVLGRIA